MDALEAIRTRRSIGRLGEPAPSDENLQQLLEAAMLAPDHNELRPQRFVILQGEAKEQFGQVLTSALSRRDPEATDGQLDKERHKFDRAPLVIAIGAKRLEANIPFSELFAATAASVENLLLAATAMGYGSMWRTGDAVYDPMVKHALGLTTEDELLGFIYLGTDTHGLQIDKTPDPGGLVTHWKP